MPMFVCRVCGQDVLADDMPAPMRWSDGHTCTFVRGHVVQVKADGGEWTYHSVHATRDEAQDQADLVHGRVMEDGARHVIIEIRWCDGKLNAVCDEPELCTSVDWDDPIRATTDSWAVADAVLDADAQVVNVEHDRDVVFVTIAKEVAK